MDQADRRLVLCLRAGLFLQTVGAARAAWVEGTPIGRLLVLPEVDKLFGIALMIAALGLLLRRMAPALIFIASFTGLIAVATVLEGAGFAPHLAPLTKMIRYAAPLALLVLIFGRSPSTPFAARWLVAFAISTVFFSHGLEAIAQHPKFLGFLDVSVGLIFSAPSASAARTTLIAIGLIDIALALMVLFRPTRAGLLYMTFWGLITAGVRIVYFGADAGAHKALLRTLNALAPLALLLSGWTGWTGWTGWSGWTARKSLRQGIASARET